MLHCISSRFKKRGRSGTTATKISHVHPHTMDLDSGSPQVAQAGSENDFVQREEDGTFSSYDSHFFFFFASNPYFGRRLIYSYSWAKPVKFPVNLHFLYIQNMPVLFLLHAHF